MNPDIFAAHLNDLFETLDSMTTEEREEFFHSVREKYCVRCGDVTPSWKCWCEGKGEDA